MNDIEQAAARKRIETAHKEFDCMKWTVEDMLQNAAEERAAGVFGGKKAVLILLDDAKPGTYVRKYYNVGMPASEMIRLLEVLKLDLYHDMMADHGADEGSGI